MKTIRLRSFTCAALVMTAAAIVACSGSDTTPTVGSNDNTPAKNNPPATPVVVTATVGDQGGTLVNSDGTGVSIPPGALPDNVTVTVTPTPDAPPPAGAEPLGTPTTFGPSGLKFEKPVTVYIAFDPSKLPPNTDVSRIVVMTAPDGTTNYEPLPTSAKDSTHVAAETTHFSIFIPVIPPPSVDAGPVATDSCVPATCQSLGSGVCGKQSDGCGGTLDCGACPTPVDASAGDDAGTTNNGGDAGTSGGDAGDLDAGATNPDSGIVDASTDGGTCKPMLCGNYGPGACGMLSDGCGSTLDCGTCVGSDGGMNSGGDGGTGPIADASAPDASVDGGTCMPLSCANYGTQQCGALPDGCGGMLSCACSTDGGSGGNDGGTVCYPIINCPTGACGVIGNGCGATLDCGACQGGDGGTAPSADAGLPPPPPPPDGGVIGTDGGTCTMQTCSPQMCGVYPNGCGGSMQCMGGCSMDGSTCKPAMCQPGACGSYPDGCGGMMYCSSGCDGGVVDASVDAAPPPPPPDGGMCKPAPCPMGACGNYPDGCGGMMFCSMGCDGGSGGADASSCMPLQCKPGLCGPQPNGCGGMLDCGPCPDAGTCTMMTCGNYPNGCGTYSNGCGGTIQCTQGCDGGFTCTPNKCQPGVCGMQADGCGGTVNCGPCDGGPACFPQSCPPMACGPMGDGCGGVLQCTGGCGMDSGTVDAAPTCMPKTCAQMGIQCGPAPDGCGGQTNCGPCPTDAGAGG